MTGGKKGLRECLQGELKTRIEGIWENAKNFHGSQRGDTIQDTKHCLTVEANLGILISDEKKEELGQTNLFFLSAAACLHDVGKVVGDNSAAWTGDHGERSEQIILQEYTALGLDRGQATVVALIVSVHENGDFDRLPQPKPDDDVNIIELAVIFRLADMLDTTYQRAPEVLSNILFKNRSIPSKWRGRQSITGWYLDNKNRIILKADPKKNEIQAVYTLKSMMREELSNMVPYLKLLGYPHELNLETSDIFIKPELKKEAAARRPFPGMDHYSREYAHTFRGRNKEIEELLANSSCSPITLLVGESGAGKTSLICAGLFPQSEIMSWKCVWTRPSNNPLENIKKTIWNAFFEGDPEGTLLDVMKQASQKCKPHTLLIAMDQFEDVLNCNVQEILDDFIQVLMAVQTGTIIPNLRVLISFREDVSVRISSRLLKQVTGSARSFPIVELERLSREGAREALLAGLEYGGIGIDTYQEMGEKPLMEIILDDIQKESDRLYPPYVQIVAETLCKRADKNKPIITKELYSELGGADKIIADYLMELLNEFDSQKSEAERTLIFLTSSTGKRVQKSLSELSQETEIEVQELKRIVEKMVDLRMVRVVDDKLEIIHDYLGRIIEEELVMEEDRIVKLLEEQLNVFHQNYMMCGTPVRSPPFLARLYRYRRRIKIDEEKHAFILCTILEEDGCLGWYWLRDIDLKRLFEIICDLVSHSIDIIREKTVIALMNIVEPEDEGRIIKMLESRDRNVRLAAVKALGKIVHSRNRMKIFEMLKDEDWEVQKAAAQVIGEIAQPKDRIKIIEMLSHEYWCVREAAVEALGKVARPEDWGLIIGMLHDSEESVSWTAGEVMKETAKPENRDEIVEILNDGRSDAREAAEGAFVKIVQPEDWDEIVQMLNDKNCCFRRIVASALEKIAQPKDKAKIIEMFSHEDDLVRRAAMRAFLKIALPEDWDDIIEMLNHEDWFVRDSAAEAFEKTAQPKDKAKIIEMFSHEDDLVRRAAMRAFLKIALPEDWDDIIEMLNHEDWFVRDSAARVMKKLAQPENWDEIVEMLDHEDWTVKRAALDALDRIARPGDREKIIEILDHEDGHVREFIIILFLSVAQLGDREKIIEMLDHEDGHVRESAVEAFLRVMPPEDRDFLLDHLADQAQGHGEKQVSIFLNLSKLDEIFYCPLHPEYPFTLLFRQ